MREHECSFLRLLKMKKTKKFGRPYCFYRFRVTIGINTFWYCFSFFRMLLNMIIQLFYLEVINQIFYSSIWDTVVTSSHENLDKYIVIIARRYILCHIFSLPLFVSIITSHFAAASWLHIHQTQPLSCYTMILNYFAHDIWIFNTSLSYHCTLYQRNDKGNAHYSKITQHITGFT